MHVIDIARNGTSILQLYIHKVVSVDGLILVLLAPSPFSATTHVQFHCIVLGYKSEIDLCATVIDRFLANMLKQMEELNGIEMVTGTTPKSNWPGRAVIWIAPQWSVCVRFGNVYLCLCSARVSSSIHASPAPSASEKDCLRCCRLFFVFHAFAELPVWYMAAFWLEQCSGHF